jgi:hypothetical protein
MAESKERSLNLRWVLIILFLLIGINGLLTRLLEGLWDSLRERNSPVYLPLEWWMSAPFTLFVFAVLSALLTSFSGFRNWLRIFLLLCAFKLVFSAVTAVFLYFRMEIGAVGAFVQAMFLSLPCVLVHLLLSGLAVMLLKDKEAFARNATQDALSTPYLVVTQLEESLTKPETPPQAPVVAAPEPVTPAGTLSLPIARVLELFPEDELVMTPGEIEQIAPSVEIPYDLILPQLPEGKVEVDAMTVVSAMPDEAFKRPPGEVARQFPDGKIELPLREVVLRVPPETFKPPPQELQPDVDGEFPDLYQELKPAVVEEHAEKPPSVAEPPAETPVREEKPEPEEVSAPSGGIPEAAFSLTEDEHLLLEASKDIVRLGTHSFLSQFPKGTVRGAVKTESHMAADGEDAGVLPQTVVVPLELVIPGLAKGEVKLPAKFILAQFPEESLSVSSEDIIRSFPGGEIEIPLREIVPELPPEVFVPPLQEAQPDVSEMPDPFREVKRPEPVVEKAAAPAGREEVSPAASAAPAVAERVEPTPVALAREETTADSYAEMLREENPLALSVDSLFGLLPEGAIRITPDELRHHLGAETLKLPRRMVMGQLKEGRVLVPVQVLMIQLSSEHLGMSVEQIKARLAEGVVELPLREIVEQVLDEIAEPPEGQLRQPECEEISTIFHEIPQEKAGPEQEQPVVTGAEVDRQKPEQPVASKRDVGPEVSAEEPTAEGVFPAEEETSSVKAWTILRSLLQKCRGLGISDHVWCSAADSHVIVLAPSSLNREAVGCGMIGIMSQVQNFCESYSLGPPFGLALSASAGALACAELVRGEADRLILLASPNKSSAGFMSLLLRRFEAQLPDLSSLVETDSKTKAGTCAGKVAGPSVNTAVHPDHLPEETCRKVVAALSEVGAEKHFSAETVSGQRVLIVWGETTPFDKRAPQSFSEQHPLSQGIFDIEAVSRHCLETGFGAFESLLLVTPQAKVTLDRSGSDHPAYLLCSFAERYAEGLVRAKARTAASFLD